MLGKFINTVKTHWKTAAILVVALLAAVILIYKFVINASTQFTVSLIHENATLGLNPDGTRFNPECLVDEKVIDALSVKTGIPAVELEDKVSISASKDNKASGIATDFVVTYKGNDKKVAEELPELVMTHYLNNYVSNSFSLLCREPDENLDYLESVNFLSMEGNRLVSYIDEKYNKSSLNSDKCFYAEYSEKAKNIVNLSLENLKTQIIEEGISKDSGALVRTLRYRNTILNNSDAQAKQQYETRTKIIEMYDSTLFPTVSVPSQMGGEYYITTTKTGLDDVYKEAKLFLNESLSINNEISANDVVIQKMEGAKLEKSDAVEQSVSNLTAELNQIYKDIDAFEKTKKASSYIVVRE